MTEPAPAEGRPKRRRRRAPPGSSPGTLVADPAAPRSKLSFAAYGPDGIEEGAVADPSAARAQHARRAVVWLQVHGLGDLEAIRSVGAAFGLHPLALEDVVNVHQRAKVESYGEVQFIVARAIAEGSRLETEQLSIFLGPGFVVTFHEGEADGYDAVRERLRSGKGRIRTLGEDYLAYALLDATVDGYFPALEACGEELETLEDEIVTSPRPESLQRVHRSKRDLLTLRRAVWPLREAIGFLLREGESRMGKEIRPYLNDCYDHTVQLMDLVETYREIASGLMEIYLSSLSNRMNEVMKVLTVIGTIFLPLSFVVGVYGMNFDRESPWNMPELGWRYGYPACLLVMAAITVWQLVLFRRRGWIGPRSSAPPPRARREP